MLLNPFISILWNAEHHHHEQIENSHMHSVDLELEVMSFFDEHTSQTTHEDVFHSDFPQIVSLIHTTFFVLLMLSLMFLYVILFRFVKESPLEQNFLKSDPLPPLRSTLIHKKILLLI
jgi:hypothetical protein